MKIRHIAMAVAVALGSSYAVADTSSGIRGVVKGPAGTPAAGTKVTIIHVPSGSTRQVVTNEGGVFNASGLRVGGPYRLMVDSDVYADTEINDVFLKLGETFQLQSSLQAESVERIQVSGAQLAAVSGDTGPAARFDNLKLETMPAVNRDIKDIIRLDPRIYVSESGSSSVRCAGGNPRTNSLTVDGVRMNDNFGLNSSGYPTERIPFSFDAIDQVAVELAPFDVQYGGFTSCNINAVTKSGSNNVEGSLFYDYTNDSLKGDKLEGTKQSLGSFSEKRYGANVGFPLVEDKLFAFIAVEKLDGTEIFDYAPLANGRVTQAQIDEIISISKDLYKYDPGTTVPSMPVEDEKLLIKLDWNINDQHRANFMYNYNNGFAIAQSDAGSDRMSLSNHFYERGAQLTAYVTSLYSDWNEDFSTELRVGYSELNNRQLSLDRASGFGEVQVLGVNGTTIYLGPDDSRQSNVLNYDNLSFKFAGTYNMEDHEFYFGYEYENLDVFNMFVQNSVGQYRFNSIADFRKGLARAYYGNAKTHNPADAAGEFAYDINTVYAQDKYRFSDIDITVTAGLRYDWYSSDDVPTLNPNFEKRYGYSNQQNLDGKDLLQPRLGVNWVVDDQLEVRGGIGLYSGGNPNVWISNSYSNDGIRNIQVNRTNMQLLGPTAVPLIGQGRPGYDIPKALYDAVGSGTADSTTNVTDPNFEIPSEWKYALGLTYLTESDYTITADLLHSRKQDSAIIKDLSLDKTGTAPDGRPVYTSRRGSNNDFLLTNRKGDDARATTFSLGVNKSFDFGLDMAMSYARTRAKDVHPMDSSVAFSNYHFVATADPENLELATSNYEVPHRFTFSMSYAHEFFSGYETRFTLFGQALQSNWFGYTFDRSSAGLGFNDGSRQLLYIPTLTDSKVTFLTEADKTAFNAWVTAAGLEGYRGSILPRNAIEGSWWNKWDVRVEQQFPGFNVEHKGSVFFAIENVGNLLNDDWGIVREGGAQNSAVTTTVNGSGQYVYKFNNPTAENRRIEPSLWEMRIGVKYNF